MQLKKIMPCLDIRGGKVVKGIHFKDVKEVADPLVQAKLYAEQGADEIAFYDIAASIEGRTLFTSLLAQVAQEANIPVTAGGGIATLADAEQILQAGAAKLSINTGAIKDTALIQNLAKRFGSEKIILSADVKKVGEGWHVFAAAGQKDTGLDALDWLKKAEADGAGAVLVNSIDADGVKGGYNLPLLRAVGEAVTLPIIASGGAGSMEHFYEALILPGVEVALGASVFHYGIIEIKQLKQYLYSKNVKIAL